MGVMITEGTGNLAKDRTPEGSSTAAEKVSIGRAWGRPGQRAEKEPGGSPEGVRAPKRVTGRIKEMGWTRGSKKTRKVSKHSEKGHWIRQLDH